MQSPTALLRKAPKWSIYAGGGVILGGVALKLYRNKTTSDSDPGNSSQAADTTTIGTPAYGAASGSPGPIISPVIIPSADTVDQSGTGLGALQELYLGGVSDFTNQMGLLMAQILGQQQELTGTLAGSVTGIAGTVSDLAAAAGAGGPPAPIGTAASPVVTAVAPPAAAPVAAPPPAFTITYKNVTKDNGLSGSKRVAWCTRQTIHHYPHGRPGDGKVDVVVDENKIKNGAC